MIRIYLAGRVAIEGGRVVDEAALPGPMGRTLLAVLASSRGPLARWWVAEVLWDHAPPEAYDQSLNPLLSKVRAAFAEAGAGRDLVTSRPGVVELRRTADVWVDVDHATASLDAAEGALRRGDHRRAWAGAAVASSIFGRPFLPGVEIDWAEERRRFHAAGLVRALEVVVDVWARQGDNGQRVTAAERLVAADPLRETSHARLIEAHLAAGNPAAAIRAFRACEGRLRSELGVSPSALVQSAYERALGSAS